jgi:acetyl-CoA carboxylase biotin carboxyl carrier protein
LAEILSAYGLTSLEISEGETHIRIEKESFTQPVSTQATTAIPATGASAATAGGNDPLELVNFSRLHEVKSPLVGVFYSAASPESETFVSVGSKVKKGDVLGIIETMKLMNEITAEQDGEIVDICIKNGDIAEYGQVLFKMF